MKKSSNKSPKSSSTPTMAKAIVAALNGEDVLYCTPTGNVVIRSESMDRGIDKDVIKREISKFIRHLDAAVDFEVSKIPGISPSVIAFARLVIHSGYVSYLVEHTNDAH